MRLDAFASRGWRSAISLAAVALLAAPGALAFQFGEGELTGSLDTTLSMGALWAVASRDGATYSVKEGGTNRNAYIDDGRLNYERGNLVYAPIKGVSDLQLNYRETTAFVRAVYFYDFALMHKDGISDPARDVVGASFEILDAFLKGGFAVGDSARAGWRVGWQALNWGESIFIQNSLNTAINPIDLTKLRQPGAEVREAFLPTPILAASLRGRAAAIEGFWRWQSKETRLEPPGTFFSTNDFVGAGATRGYPVAYRYDQRCPYTLTSSSGAGLPPPLFFFAQCSGYAPRGADVTPRNGREFGVALHYVAPALNETDFGVYFLNTASTVPFANGQTGRGGLPGTLTPTPTGAPGTASYFLEYPESIRTWGLSFNTPGPFGIALQGEYSFRDNQPLQHQQDAILQATLGGPSELRRGADGVVRGWTSGRMHQLQLGATTSIPDVLGAASMAVVGEAGFTYLDFPTTVNGFPTAYGGTGAAPKCGTPTALGRVPGGSATAGPCGTDGFYTSTSWGYVLFARLDYYNLIPGATVSPRVAWRQDVQGFSPTWSEGARQITLGVGISYKNWGFDLAYTNFLGGKDFVQVDGANASPLNPGGVPPPAVLPGPRPFPSHQTSYPIRDRDYLAVSVSYSF
jgi:hypothetical protein